MSIAYLQYITLGLDPRKSLTGWRARRLCGLHRTRRSNQGNNKVRRYVTPVVAQNSSRLPSASKWSLPASGLKITPIVTDPSCLAPGEALRDVYTHGIITSDFVLVFGDLVSNVRLDEVVRVHKSRRRTDKDAIMTMVVKEAGAEHRTRCVVRSCRVSRLVMEAVSDRWEIRGCLSWTQTRRSVCIMRLWRVSR